MRTWTCVHTWAALMMASVHEVTKKEKIELTIEFDEGAEMNMLCLIRI